MVVRLETPEVYIIHKCFLPDTLNSFRSISVQEGFISQMNNHLLPQVTGTKLYQSVSNRTGSIPTCRCLDTGFLVPSAQDESMQKYSSVVCNPWSRTSGNMVITEESTSCSGTTDHMWLDNTKSSSLKIIRIMIESVTMDSAVFGL